MRRSGLEREPLTAFTLGLLVDSLEDNYQNTVLCGVADAALEHGVNLFCFIGGVLRSPQRAGAERNIIYTLAGPENVDGLLVMSGTLSNAIGPLELLRYCERYRPLPMCSIAVALPGVPSVLVDNATGMREVIVHQIEAHDHRRVAFIRGPSANDEAERRYGVYRDVLAEHGVAIDLDLVAVGDFSRPSGAEAIRLLLDDRKAEIDAIVAANDDMALGAIDALHARGVRVPQDIAVVGFDDVEEGRFATPPLTTARQPLYEQGKRAVATLLAQIRGEAVPCQVTLHTELVTRRSCGCLPASGSLLAPAPPRPPPRDAAAPSPSRVEEALRASRPRMIASLSAAMRAPAASAGHDWGERLLDSLAAELTRGPSGVFTSSFDDILRQVLVAGGEVSAWQDAISALRRMTLPCLDDAPDLRARAEDLFQEARILVGDATERAQAQHRLSVERWARALSETAGALLTAFDVVTLVNAVARQLPRLQMESCYLSLYERGQNPAESARLILAYDAARTPSARTTEIPFPSRELVPRGVLPEGRRTTFVVEPLFFKSDQLGFVLFEMGPRDGAIYESLRDQLSAALKGARLVHEVERRALELEHANQAIRENQEKLLISEKLASLGRLTASIVHEMNTPLAAVRAALVDLGKLVTEYERSVGDPEVTIDDHREIAGEMRQAIELAGGAAERAALFVRGIKSQTRDMGPQEDLPFNVVTCIRQALLLQSYALRKGNCSAVFEPPADYLELHGSPVRLSQVVTNLVENAIDASLPKGGGPITIALSRQSGGLKLQVSDTGTGVPEEILGKIFEPMFTTKPFGQGTGLGLSLVRDIVTGDFGGAIDVATEPGLGTTFTVTFPHPRTL